jgi:ribonuclease G
MEREILIDTQEVQERRVAVAEDGTLEEYYIERTDVTRHIGNVCKSRVINVVPGIQAAFVDIGLEKNGFLHIDDVDISSIEAIEAEEGEERPAVKPKHTREISEMLSENQELMVQVVKEPMGTKGVRLTTNISLPGRFLVLLPFEHQIAISRKISAPEERRRLRKLANEVNLPDGAGLIVRTAGEGCTTKEFITDAEYLLNLWKVILHENEQHQPPAVLHCELDLVLRTIRDSFSEDVARIVINSREEHARVMEFVRQLVPSAQRNIQLYEGKLPIFEKWNVQKDIDRAFRRKIWLKCGGYIVIDETEALIAIDVNSGRHVSPGNLEDTVTQTNLEAADEVARQLRLRNVGGLVIIDFIDMRNRQNQRDVLMRLQNALKKDKARSSILPISEFGLVEMTRQRVKESISDAVYDQCPYCKGRGSVKSVVSICIDLQRTLKNIMLNHSERDIRIEVHPIVAESLRQSIVILQNFEDRYGARLTVCSRERLHVEDFTLYNHRSGKVIHSNA